MDQSADHPGQRAPAQDWGQAAEQHNQIQVAQQGAAPPQCPQTFQCLRDTITGTGLSWSFMQKLLQGIHIIALQFQVAQCLHKMFTFAHLPLLHLFEEPLHPSHSLFVVFEHLLIFFWD